jgi:hypothetical protein
MANEPSWKEQKQRDDLASRKQKDEQSRDPLIEQCVIAYVSAVQQFGPRPWDQFRREWLIENAKSAELQEAAKQKASESYMTETKETANGTESR